MPEIRSVPRTVGFNMPMGKFGGQFTGMAKNIEGLQKTINKKKQKIAEKEQEQKETRGKWEDQQQYGEGNEDFDYGSWNENQDREAAAAKARISKALSDRAARGPQEGPRKRSSDVVAHPGEQPPRQVRDPQTGKMASNPEYHEWVPKAAAYLSTHTKLAELKGQPIREENKVPQLAQRHVRAAEAGVRARVNSSMSSTQMNSLTPNQSS
jgi:hypothetical protein